MTELPYPISEEVPPPEKVAVWAALGLTPIRKLPLWAAHWLVAGYDGENLIHLAGLPGEDSHETYDALPAALDDCGVSIPKSDVAAATVVFTDLARMHLNGQAGPQWIGQKVEEVLCAAGYPADLIALPLGSLYCIADEWDEGWGRPVEQLIALVHDRCEEQVRTGTATP